MSSSARACHQRTRRGTPPTKLPPQAHTCVQRSIWRFPTCHSPLKSPLSSHLSCAALSSVSVACRLCLSLHHIIYCRRSVSVSSCRLLLAGQPQSATHRATACFYFYEVYSVSARVFTPHEATSRYRDPLNAGDRPLPLRYHLGVTMIPRNVGSIGHYLTTSLVGECPRI